MVKRDEVARLVRKAWKKESDEWRPDYERVVKKVCDILEDDESLVMVDNSYKVLGNSSRGCLCS